MFNKMIFIEHPTTILKLIQQRSQKIQLFR